MAVFYFVLKNTHITIIYLTMTTDMEVDEIGTKTNTWDALWNSKNFQNVMLNTFGWDGKISDEKLISTKPSELKSKWKLSPTNPSNPNNTLSSDYTPQRLAVIQSTMDSWFVIILGHRNKVMRRKKKSNGTTPSSSGRKGKSNPKKRSKVTKSKQMDSESDTSENMTPKEEMMARIKYLKELLREQADTGIENNRLMSEHLDALYLKTCESVFS